MFNNMKIMIFYADFLNQISKANFKAKVMKYLIKQDQRLENRENFIKFNIFFSWSS